MLTIARNHGAKTAGRWSAALEYRQLARVTVVAQIHATQGVLILPADLPLLTQEDVLTLIDRAAKPPVVVIAPDRHGKATNALLMVPAGQIEYDFWRVPSNVIATAQQNPAQDWRSSNYRRLV